MEHVRIRQTLAAYCQRLDDGRFGEWDDVFTDDVAFAVMGQRETVFLDDDQVGIAPAPASEEPS